MSITTVLDVFCVSCSRKAKTDNDLKKLGWRLRPDHPVIVQKKCIALCPACAVGDMTFTEGCSRDCKGDYRPASGEYFVAVNEIGDNRDEWACHDVSCVEEWLGEQDSDCPTCGTFDASNGSIFHYVDGRKVS